MSTLEDEIRGALRTEAGRLRAVRPLRLPSPAARDERRPLPGASLARRLAAWRAPLAAVAAVVLIAVLLVIVRSAGKEQAAPVVVPPSPIAGPPLPPDAAPRYYLKLGVARVTGQPWAIIVGDGQTGRIIATYPLGKGDTITSAAVSGAGDDRTFVVSAAVDDYVPGHAGQVVVTPPLWYLVRIFPGAAHPIRVTRLAVNFNEKADGTVRDLALSADGTELAVMSQAGKGKPFVLGVYSVATGQMQHSWSGVLGTTAPFGKPVSDLSWAGDRTVGFAVTDIPGVREEVRTLDTGAAGTSLLAASRVVWSQYVPAPPPGSRHAPQACSTPFLTGNGQAVVCGTSSYSARDKRLSAVWLAYPLATPARPRVIGSIPLPADVSSLDFLSVGWTNPSGTEIIGYWWPSEVTGSGAGQTTTTQNLAGVIGNGTVRPFAGLMFSPYLVW
jgi:hypothetical protein